MKITVMGAGNSGLAMAAYLSYFGHEISLWNRSLNTIQNLITNKIINMHGIIEACVDIKKITIDICEALENSELILITTPANSHRDLARLLAKNMKNNIPIILNPGRTFGALNFHEEFIRENKLFEPIVAETQTIIYTCRKDNERNVTIYSLKSEVKIATLKKSNMKFVMEKLPDCIRDYYKPVDSFLETSLGNVGMVLHCVPFMLNTGWTECDSTEYKYYYDGITPTIGKFIEHIDIERIEVAKKLGLELETTLQWMEKEYGVHGNSLYECIKNNEAYKEIDAPRTIHHRYIFEDVPNGLVPVEQLGRHLEVQTTYISLAIDLANALMETDFRKDSKYITMGYIEKFK